MRNEKEISTAKETLKDKLSAIILLESKKSFEEMDCELIDECVDFLMELEGKTRLSKGEIEQRVNAVPFNGKITELGSDTGKKFRAKRLAIIAAVIALIAVIFSMVSLASEDSFGNLLYRTGNSLVEILDKRDMDYKDVSIHKNDKTVIYQTVEEFVEAENTEILYPSWLPENVNVLNILCFIEEEKICYSILCSNSVYSVSIRPDITTDEEIKLNNPMKEINGFEVYYFTTDLLAQGTFMHNSTQYQVTASNEKELFEIIKNLKEIN